MKKRTIVSCAALAAIVIGGCASRQPSPELVDARTAYARATAGPATQVNPAGLYEARRALDAAEKKQDDSPGSDEARNLAYVADRKVLLAEANARLTLAQNEDADAKAKLAQLEASQLNQARGQVNADRTQIQQQQQMLQTESKARQEADKRAKDSLDRLAAFASVKEETRGMVITLSGSVLFETNKADLMPSARARLSEVASALKEVEGRHINVIGYTDTVGSDDYNKDLSKRRAESVKDFLASQGVRKDLLTSDGRGKADPVASNATPEGRANNRRVEIVVEGSGGSNDTTPDTSKGQTH